MIAIYLLGNRQVATMFDWEQDFYEDQTFINRTLEIMVDQLHDYVVSNEHQRAESMAEAIRSHLVDRM